MKLKFQGTEFKFHALEFLFQNVEFVLGLHIVENQYVIIFVAPLV